MGVTHIYARLEFSDQGGCGFEVCVHDLVIVGRQSETESAGYFTEELLLPENYTYELLR